MSTNTSDVKRDTHQKRRRLIIIFSILGALLLIIAANAHLVYVAVISQPECIEHLKDKSAETGRFRAAKSAC
ncbi:MAG: putative membrane protein SpoIIM required for sporulation [Hyphomicrobiaceae bacterium]|jgi:uncharacterized membrane protein SpoIIM required for sporulation